ncbi:uncharacterized protein DS421_16g536330 [Arachis hypogaea]|nr:uncharacterized protein DS421_16g536330 [Arachis hypogaea]
MSDHHYSLIFVVLLYIFGHGSNNPRIRSSKHLNAALLIFFFLSFCCCSNNYTAMFMANKDYWICWESYMIYPNKAKIS